MKIRCGIIENGYEKWLEARPSQHHEIEFMVSYLELVQNEPGKLIVRVENSYELMIVDEDDYFSLDQAFRTSLSDHSLLIITGEVCDYQRVRQAFLEGCFDYLQIPMEEDTHKEMIQRLSEHFLQSERKMIQLAKGIAEEIAAVHPKTERLFLEYWSKIDVQKAGSDYQRNDYAKAIERLIAFLPLKPIRLPLIDLAQGAAEWICQAEYSQERFMATVLFIQQTYRDIFLPHCQHDLVRRAIELYLDEQFDVETVQDLSDHLYVNRSYLSKTFITESDTDLTRYMMRTKMYGARLFLLDSRLSVYDVMEYLRYTDYGHFRKTFKKYTGITPSEYVAAFRDRFSVEVAQK